MEYLLILFFSRYTIYIFANTETIYLFSSYEPALPKVLPVLELGVKKAKERGILPMGLSFSFTDYDDECNNVYGQISALDAYVTVKPHVIFGPSCEYSVGEFLINKNPPKKK